MEEVNRKEKPQPKLETDPRKGRLSNRRLIMTQRRKKLKKVRVVSRPWWLVWLFWELSGTKHLLTLLVHTDSSMDVRAQNEAISSPENPTTYVGGDIALNPFTAAIRVSGDEWMCSVPSDDPYVNSCRT